MPVEISAGSGKPAILGTGCQRHRRARFSSILFGRPLPHPGTSRLLQFFMVLNWVFSHFTSEYSSVHNAAMMKSGLELNLEISASEVEDAKKFLGFLRKAAQKHSVTMSSSVSQTGGIALSVPQKESVNLDSFLQELIVKGGLYYYLCTVANRRKVARSVVKPIIEKVLVSRFSVVYPVLIQRYLLDGSPDWTPGEFMEEFARDYENLFQRFQLRMISGYIFIRDLDDLLTEFMLCQLRHKKGEQSPKFNVLVDRCGKQDILREKNVRKLFNRVHALRTHGLHRLERDMPDAELSEIAQSVYNFFEWLDDYWEAQEQKTVILRGHRYRRVPYGDELARRDRHPSHKMYLTDELRAAWVEGNKKPCHDCGVIAGEFHLDGCDWEVCPRCNGQYLGCPCAVDEAEVLP
jgi:hypothetical protein